MFRVYDISWMGLTDNDLGIIDDILNMDININITGIENYLYSATKVSRRKIEMFLSIIDSIRSYEDNGCNVYMFVKGRIIVNGYSE